MLLIYSLIYISSMLTFLSWYFQSRQNSWLTVSNQIVKSISLCHKKSYFFNMVQPINLIFWWSIVIVEQNFFNHADFGLLYFAQDSLLNAQHMPKMHKIVLLSPIHNISTRFAQDCTSFSKTQYMCNICARLYLFLQCIRFAQDCTSFSNAQYIRKICTRLITRIAYA